MAKQQKTTALNGYNEADLIQAVKTIAAETPYKVVGYTYTQADGKQTVVLTLQAPVDAQDKQQVPHIPEAVVRQVPIKEQPETHYSAFTVEDDADIPLNGSIPTERNLLEEMVASTTEDVVSATELTAENAADLLKHGVLPQQEKVIRQPEQGEKFYDETVLNSFFKRTPSNIGEPEEEEV